MRQKSKRNVVVLSGELTRRPAWSVQPSVEPKQSIATWGAHAYRRIDKEKMVGVPAR